METDTTITRQALLDVHASLVALGILMHHAKTRRLVGDEITRAQQDITTALQHTTPLVKQTEDCSTGNIAGGGRA